MPDETLAEESWLSAATECSTQAREQPSCRLRGLQTGVRCRPVVGRQTNQLPCTVIHSSRPSGNRQEGRRIMIASRKLSAVILVVFWTCLVPQTAVADPIVSQR